MLDDVMVFDGETGQWLLPSSTTVALVDAIQEAVQGTFWVPTSVFDHVYYQTFEGHIYRKEPTRSHG